MMFKLLGCTWPLRRAVVSFCAAAKCCPMPGVKDLWMSQPGKKRKKTQEKGSVVEAAESHVCF